MKQGTMNILFRAQTKLLKNSEAPVLMRITINGATTMPVSKEACL